MKNQSKVTITTIILAIIFAIVGFLAGFGFYLNSNKASSDVLSMGEISFHFMMLGNKDAGDCIYIKCGETDILIDAGSQNSSSKSIISYVDQYVTDNTLEYVIATHADQDHISAFYSTQTNEGIFDHYEIEVLIDFDLTNKTPTSSNPIGRYYDAREQIISNGTIHYTASQCFNNQDGGQRTFQISDNVEMEILYNYYYENKFSGSDDNNYSVCLMFNQGDSHYLFTGDLEEEGEEYMVDYYADKGGLPKCVLYKAGHHGSKTSSTAELLAQIQPEYVVVCCCAGTSQYTDIKDNQFPTQDFINRVAPYTSKIYIPTMVSYYEENGEIKETYAQMNGNIVVTAMRYKVTVDCSNNNTVLKDTEWFKANRTWPE